MKVRLLLLWIAPLLAVVAALVPVGIGKWTGLAGGLDLALSVFLPMAFADAVLSRHRPYLPAVALSFLLAGLRFWGGLDGGYDPVRQLTGVAVLLAAWALVRNVQQRDPALTRVSWRSGLPATLSLLAVDIALLLAGMAAVALLRLPGFACYPWIVVYVSFRNGVLSKLLALLIALPGFRQMSRLRLTALRWQFLADTPGAVSARVAGLRKAMGSNATLNDIEQINGLRLALDQTNLLDGPGAQRFPRVTRLVLLRDPGDLDHLELTAEVAELDIEQVKGSADVLSRAMEALARQIAADQTPAHFRMLQLLSRLIGRGRAGTYELRDPMFTARQLAMRAEVARGTVLLCMRLLQAGRYDLAVVLSKLIADADPSSPFTRPLFLASNLLWLVDDFQSVWPRLDREFALELMVLSAPERAGLLDWDSPLIMDGEPVHRRVLDALRNKPGVIAAILFLWERWDGEADSRLAAVMQILTRAKLRPNPLDRRAWARWWVGKVQTLDYPAILSLEGILSFRDGNARQGLQQLQRAAELAPQAPFAHRNLAWGYCETNDVTNCRAACSRLLELAPNDGEQLLAAARILLKANDIPAAQAYLRRAVHGGDEPRRAVVALGAMALFSNNALLALPILEVLRQEFPGDQRVILLAGLCYQRLDDHQQAAGLFRQLLSGQPPEQGVHVDQVRFLLATSLKEMGQEQEARQMLGPVTPENFKDVAAVDQVAAMFEELHDFQRARDFWDRSMWLRMSADGEDDDPGDDDSGLADGDGSSRPPDPQV